MKILKIILFASIPVLLCLLVISHYKNLQLNKDLKTLTEAKSNQDSQVLQEAKILNRKISKDGIETVTMNALSNILPVDKVLKSITVDSIAKANEIKPKLIISYVQTGFVSEAKYLKAVNTIDSLKRRVATYQNKWINISYTDKKDSTDTVGGFFKYKYNGSLSQLQHYSQYSFLGLKFGRKDALINSALVDSNAYISGIKNFSVAVQPKKFSISLQARTVLNITSQKFVLGPGVSIDFKERTNFLGYAYYNFAAGRIEYAIGINKNLITF